MGREVRRVPADWQHPKHSDDHWEPHRRGRFIPLHKGGFAEADAEWTEGFQKWTEGFVWSYGDKGWRPRSPEDGIRFTEWHGERPSPDDYMPDWPDDQRTHLMMYEDTSEGTPISPPFETPEALARWLADTGASSFGDSGATYEQWLYVARGGWAPSLVVSGGVVQSGIEFAASSEQPPPACEQREQCTPATDAKP